MKFEELPKLPFEIIREELDSVLTAIPNKLEREWAKTQWAAYPGAAVLLRATVLVSANTYNTIRFICADIPPDPSRKLEYSISVPPLARTILDSVFTVVFLFEDLPRRLEWYEKSGWRELHEECQRLLKRYASDPAWASRLAEHSKLLGQTKVDFGITPAEEANPKTILRWPNPGQMMKHSSTSTSRIAYLTYVNDWFYRELSAASHLSWPGLASRAAYLFKQNDTDRENTLKIYRSNSVMTTITLLLALLSEIQIELEYDLGTKLKYVWGILNGFWSDARDLWNHRYEALL